ncbi:MAG TPA: D-alanyl-D-alanine carboxypeptidase family protein [Candidatus Nanopelagicaceae bacterium]
MRSKIPFFAIAVALVIGILVFILSIEVDGESRSSLQTPTPTPTQLVSQSPTPVSTSTPTPTKAVKPIRLLCMNRTTKALRTSDVAAGCRKGESSLGATAIKPPAKRPTDLNPFLKTRFLAAQAAAKKARRYLAITSGFRSYALQASLFAAAVKKYGSEAEAAKAVLPPEFSHHPWGLALDINYPNDPLSAKWLEINGYKYGLCRVYKNEWWHFEGVIAPGRRCPALHPDATWDLE